MPLFGSSSSSDEDFPQPRKSKTPRGLARFKNVGSQSGIPSNNSCSSSRHVEPSSTQVQSSSVSSHVDATSCPGESSGRGTGASLARSSSQASAVRLGLDGSSTPSLVVSDVRTGSTTVRSLSRQTPLFVFSSPPKLRHQRLSEDDDTDMEITLETEPESTDDDSTCDEAATLGSVEEWRPCKQDSGRTASPAASDEVVPESEAENEDSDEEMDLQDDPYSQSLFSSEGPRQSQIGTGRDSKRSAGQSCEAERTVVEETESSEACGDEDSDETMEPTSPPDVSMSMPTGSCAVREHGPVWESGPQSELSLNKSGSRTSSIDIHSAEERLKDTQVVSEHFGSVCPGQPKKVLPGTDSMISRLKKWGSEFKERVQSKGASFTLAASTISNKKANKNLTASDDDELVLISEDEEGDRACTALKAEHVPVSMEEQSITESDEELLSISVETEASEDFQRATQTSAQPDTSSASTTSNISTLATITTRVETREPSRKRNASGQEVTGPGSGGSFAKRRHVSTPSQSTLSGHSDQSTLSKQNSILSSSTVKNKASGPSQSDLQSSTGTSVRGTPGRSDLQSSTGTSVRGTPGRSDLQSSTGTSVRGTPGRSDLQSSTGTSMRATPCRSNLQGKPSSAVGAAGAGEGSSLSVPADEKFPVQVKTEPGVGVASAAVPWPMYSQEHRVIIISDSEEDDDSDTERESSPSLLSVKQEEELHSEYATDSNGDLFSDPDSDVEIYHSEAEEEHPNMSYGFSPREDHNTASPPTCHEDESVSGEEDRQPRRASIKADASENQEAALSRIKSEPFDPVLDGSSGEALSETQLRAPEHAREGSADARPGITDLLFREEMPASDVSRYVVNRYIINPDSYDDLSGPSSDLGFREEQATAPHPQPQSGDAGLLLGVQVKHEPMDIDKNTHSMPPCDFPSHRTGRQPLPSTSSATASGGRNLPVYDEDSSRDIKIPGRVNSTLGDVPSRSSSAPWPTAVGASIIRGTLPIDNTAASPHQSLDKVSNQTVPMDSDYLAATQVDDSTVMRQSYNISTLQYRAACSVDATRSLGSNPAAVDGVCRDAQGANSSKNEAYEALTQVDPVSRKKRGRPLPPADVDRYDYDALTQVDSIGPWGDNPGNALELPGMERSAELRSTHEEDEDAYFPATQVDEVSSSLDSEEKPSTEAGDGDPYLASTQVDNRHSSQLRGSAMDKETLAGNSVLNDADVFSAATQVDRLAGGNSPRTSNRTTSSVGRNAEEDEDEDYFAATQVDPQVSSSRNTDKSAYLEPTLCNADDTCSNDSAYLDQTQVDDDNDWLYHEPTQLDPAPTSLKLSKLVPRLSSKKDKERQVKAQLIEPLRQPMTAKSIRQKLQSRRQSTSRPEPAAGSAASVQKDDRSSGGSGWLSKPKSQAPKRKSSSSKAPKTKKRKRKSSPEGMSMTQQIKAATVAKNRRSSKTQGTKPKDKGTPAVPDAGDLLDVEPPNTQDVYALGLPLLNLPRIICKLKEHLATATTETPGPVTPGPSQRGDGTKGPSHQDAGSSKDGSRASGHSSVRESRFEPVTSLGTGFQVSALPDSSDKGKSFLSKSESGARLPASSSSKDKTSSLSESDREKLHAANCQDVVVLVEKSLFLDAAVMSSLKLSSSFPSFSSSSFQSSHKKPKPSSYHPSSSKLSPASCSSMSNSSHPACPTHTHVSSSLTKSPSKWSCSPSDRDHILSTASKTAAQSENSSTSVSKAGGLSSSLSESDREKLHAANCQDVVVLVEKSLFLDAAVMSSLKLSSSFPSFSSSSFQSSHKKPKPSSYHPSSSKLSPASCSSLSNSSHPACPTHTHVSLSLTKSPSKWSCSPSDRDHILSTASKTAAQSENSSTSVSKAGGLSSSKTAKSRSKASGAHDKRSESSSFSHEPSATSRSHISASHKLITSASTSEKPHFSSTERSEKSGSKQSHSLSSVRSHQPLSKSSASLTSASKASSSSKASDAASTNHRSSSNLPKTYDVMGGILAKMSRTGSSGKSRNSFDGMEGSMASKKPVGLPLVNAMPVLDKLPSQAARMVGQVQDPPAPAPLVPLRLVSSVPAAVTDMGSSLEGEVRASQSEPQPSTMQAAASSVSCRGGSAGWNQDPRLAQRPAQVSSRELSGLQDPNSGSGGVSSSSTCTTASTTSSSSSTTASTTSSSTSAATSTTSSSTSTAASTTKNSSIPITGISNKCTTTTSVVSNSSSSIAPSLPTQLAKSLQRGLSAVEQPATPRSAPMAPGNPSLPLVSGPPNSAVSHLRQAASDQPKLASILEARPRRAMSADARSSAMLPSLPPGVPSTSILQHGLQGCKKSWQLPVLDLRARPDLGRRVSADQPRNEKGGLSMNDFYFRLVKWNTVWLEEQEMQRLAPPVAKQCFPLVDSYTSLYEYQDIMMNLLLYETWEDVSRDWSAHRNGSFQLKMNLERYSKETPDMLKLTWIGLENWRCGNQAADLQQGTLAIVKWKEKMEGGKKGLSQRFAYIKEKSMMPAGLKIHYPALNKLPQATDPNVLVRVTMLMRDNYNCSPFIGTIVDVELVCNIMTRVRQASALCYLQHSPLQQDILSPADLKSETFRWPSEKGRRESGNLNPQQAKVVNQMMEVVTNKKRKFIGLLQGPPGTGKSFTIVSLISRIYLSVKKRNPSPSEPDPSARVLLAAPSNNAINELVRRLINARESDPKLRNLSIVRIGRSGQLDSKINQHSLDSRVQELWRRELEVQQQSLPESVRAQMDRVKERVRKKKKELESCQPADRRMVEGDIKKLNTELQKLANGSNSSMQTNGQMSRRKEDELKQKALKEAHVVCGTLNSFGNDRILSLSLLLSRGKGSPFVCAIVDEATQALEVDSLIPLQYDINTLLLVGDQEQLPATCMSKKAEEQNFGMSLFERCFKLFKDRGKTEHMHMLNMQHRMNPEVCHFPNKHVYNDKLVNHSVVLEPAILFHLRPYLLFDLDSSQEHSSQPGSISNQSEAEFTAKLCQTIRREQSRYSKEQSRYTVAVICPYRTQCDLIRRKNKERAFDDIEVGTVDSFQGQERDIIILSCVRANSSSGTIGFLDNRKRMNVALTRACRAVYIVGHLSSLQVSPDWEALIRNARERKLIVHVQAGAEEEAAARILEPKTAALQS